MASSVFDAFIKSVYTGGSSINFFDSIQGGQDDLEIFGGVNPAEILDEIEGFNTKKETPNEEESDSSDSESEEEEEEKEAECDKTPIVDDTKIPSKKGKGEEDLFNVFGAAEVTVEGAAEEVTIEAEVTVEGAAEEVKGGSSEDDLFNVFGGSEDEEEDIVAPMNTCISEDITAPIEIELCPKKVKIDAKSIGDTLKKLTSS